MSKRWIAALIVMLGCTSSAGCEITASAVVQQEWRTDSLVNGKPDGLAKAEIKITRLVGRDKKR